MGLILKIAAGIIIGFLVLQIMFYQKVDSDYEEMSVDIQLTQDLRNKYIGLTNSLHSYFRRNESLPNFISDLSCTDMFNHRQKIACAEVFDGGVFYVNNESDWASAKPYVLDGKLFIECATSRSMSIGEDSYRDCLDLDVANIPRLQSPSFSCDSATSNVEKIICSSDRLVQLDANLAAAYKDLISRSPEDKTNLIKDDRIKFIAQRNKECDTIKCIKEMTKKKISRLKFLGV